MDKSTSLVVEEQFKVRCTPADGAHLVTQRVVYPAGWTDGLTDGLMAGWREG